MTEIIGKNIKYLSTIDSTNNYATSLIKKNQCFEGDVYVAEEQTLGRGQIRNSWESEKGKNILMSIVLFPSFLPIQFQFLLSKVVALGLFEVVSAYTENVSIKWPNDLYIQNRKVAGILIENSIMGSSIDSCTVGIGLNVNQIHFTSDAPNPVSLAIVLGKDLEKATLMQQVLEAIDNWYLKLIDHQLETIDNAYLNALYKRNQMATYNDSDGKYQGKILGINPIGQLIIQKENNSIKVYHFKEVEFVH